MTYQIVGDDEADLKLGLISISSPIARALIGKEDGDVAEVQAPGGIKQLRDHRTSATSERGARDAARRRCSPALWVGLPAVRRRSIAAPALFATLPTRRRRPRRRPQLFAVDALTLGVGAVLLLIAGAARRCAEAAASRFSTEMLLALGALFCTVAGYFALQPMMRGGAARAAARSVVRRCCTASRTAFFALKGLRAWSLRWRGAGRGAPASAAPSS